MIRSMTSFARQASQHDWGSLVWEIRSVNHRYLEPSFKLPESMRRLENELREKLRKSLSRGKVECSLRVQFQAGGSSGQLSVNKELLAQLISAGETVQQQLRDPAALNPLQLLQWPGIMSEPETDSDLLCEQALALFVVTLEQLVESREREGAALKQFIEQRLDTIGHINGAVKQQLPDILQAQRQKLQERLEELKAELNPDRLEQEMVILAQKADVDEELDRLDAHLIEVRRVLTKGGACGRRLDFLMQELNREANTLSSKSIVTDTTQAAVELKVLIEQMREQIQNIE
ncbi:YicC/YloC family endoribonuclease [Oceanicoccus sagamiensis]|uniref:YicC family protein n=1 Tax=Oceanicoccus sagamiensis TaxID=716816 RepID=A0A1X9NKL7_9GAMM|nr:YicC/YloC family endoribonuclease [Oceanicoccus sagamiensis]ARN76345.1 YicC family protein [Oceanicoccus sagamiensis]